MEGAVVLFGGVIYQVEGVLLVKTLLIADYNCAPILAATNRAGQVGHHFGNARFFGIPSAEGQVGTC